MHLLQFRFIRFSTTCCIDFTFSECLFLLWGIVSSLWDSICIAWAAQIPRSATWADWTHAKPLEIICCCWSFVPHTPTLTCIHSGKHSRGMFVCWKMWPSCWLMNLTYEIIRFFIASLLITPLIEQIYQLFCIQRYESRCVHSRFNKLHTYICTAMCSISMIGAFADNLSMAM